MDKQSPEGMRPWKSDMFGWGAEKPPKTWLAGPGRAGEMCGPMGTPAPTQEPRWETEQQ